MITNRFPTTKLVLWPARNLLNAQLSSARILLRLAYSSTPGRQLYTTGSRAAASPLVANADDVKRDHSAVTWKYVKDLQAALDIQNPEFKAEQVARILTAAKAENDDFSLFRQIRGLPGLEKKRQKSLTANSTLVLVTKWRESRDKRALILSVLMELLFADIKLFKVAFRKLYFEVWRDAERHTIGGHKQSFEDTLNSRSTKKGFRIQMCARIFDISVSRGMPLVGASLGMLALENNVRIGTARMFKLFHSLLVWDPKLGHVKMAALAKMYLAYDKRWRGTLLVPAEVKSMIVSTGMQLCSHYYPSFANDCMDIAMRMRGDPVPVYLVYELINENLRFGNAARAAELWRYARRHYSRNMQLDSVHVPDMLHLFAQHDGYSRVVDEILDVLPLREYGRDGVSEAVLRYAAKTQHTQLAHRVYQVLPHPLRLSVLSASLELHCAMDDTEGVRKLVNELERRGGMSAEDSVVIVDSLAASDLNAAAGAIESMSWPPHATILQYERLIRRAWTHGAGNHDMVREYLDKMYDMVAGHMHRDADRPTRLALHSRGRKADMWSQDIATYVNLRLDYVASSDIAFARKLWQTNYARVREYLPAGRIKGLAAILRHAIISREQDDHLPWLFQELLALGLSASDIIGMVFNQMRDFGHQITDEDANKIITLATSLERTSPALLHDYL